MKTYVLGNWSRKKEKLRQRYQVLTDKDLHFSEGKENEMIEVLGNKLGKTRQELLFIIVDL